MMVLLTSILTLIVLGIMLTVVVMVHLEIGSDIYKRGEDNEVLPGLYNFLKRIDMNNNQRMYTGLISGIVRELNIEWLTPSIIRIPLILLYFNNPIILIGYGLASITVVGFKKAQVEEEADAVEGSVEEIIIKNDPETAQESETMNGQENNQEFEEVEEDDVNTEEELVIPSIFSVGPEEIAGIRTQDNEYGFTEIEDTLEDDYKPLMTVDEDDKF